MMNLFSGMRTRGCASPASCSSSSQSRPQQTSVRLSRSAAHRHAGMTSDFVSRVQVSRRGEMAGLDSSGPRRNLAIPQGQTQAQSLSAQQRSTVLGESKALALSAAPDQLQESTFRKRQQKVTIQYEEGDDASLTAIPSSKTLKINVDLMLVSRCMERRLRGDA